MNTYGLKDDVIAFIINAAKEHGLSKVVLFGSRATGKFSEKSDIDLAVSGGSLDGFRCSIEEKCPTLLEFDIIDMDQDLNEGLINQIVEEGDMLYEV